MKQFSLRGLLLLSAVLASLSIIAIVLIWWQTSSRPASIGEERSAQRLTPDPHLYARLLQVVGPLEGETVQPLLGLTPGRLWLVEIELRNTAVRIDPPFTLDPSRWKVTVRDGSGRRVVPLRVDTPIAGEDTVWEFSSQISSGQSERARFAFHLGVDRVLTEVWLSADDALSRSLPWLERTPLHSKVVWAIPPATDR